MPFTYRIDEQARTLHIRAEGAITQAERIAAISAWLADPKYAACVDALCDFSAADTTPQLSELRELIGLLSERMPAAGPRKLAVIAPKPVTFGVARVFEDLVRLEGLPIRVKVFFERELAEQWLRPTP